MLCTVAAIGGKLSPLKPTIGRTTKLAKNKLNSNMQRHDHAESDQKISITHCGSHEEKTNDGTSISNDRHPTICAAFGTQEYKIPRQCSGEANWVKKGIWRTLAESQKMTFHFKGIHGKWAVF